jgi:hypothetical protein
MAPPAIYRQRRPQESALYQCLEQCWEEFKQVYALFYQSARFKLCPPPSLRYTHPLELADYLRRVPGIPASRSAIAASKASR